MSAGIDERRAMALTYVNTVFGSGQGYACLAFGVEPHLNDKGRYTHDDWIERFWSWPDEREALIDEALEKSAACDVYVAPLLRSARNRQRESALPGSVLWADIDDPSKAVDDAGGMIGPGGMVVLSGGGEGTKHVYLAVPEALEPAEIEVMNRRLAIALGADAKWDTAAVLRLPGTWNHKPRVQGRGAVLVRIAPTPFPAAHDLTLEELAERLPKLPEVLERPSGPIALEPPPLPLPQDVLRRLLEDPRGDRSGQTFGLMAACREAGLTAGQAVHLGLRHRPTLEKYGDRSQTQLERIVTDPLKVAFPEALAARTASDLLLTEPWREFRERAEAEVPCLIEGLWPEAAFGFLSAPPKAGKTWLALSLSLAVATGLPFLGRFAIPCARPILYVALEGHRAALKARIGCLARGLGIDPDGDSLDNLHIAYKPRGINLAEPTWALALLEQARELGAGLVIVDVLRRAARIKENDAHEFMALAGNLEPLAAQGIALGLLHHFGKLTELTKERVPAERMAGSGSMHGALDVGLYITNTTARGRALRIEFESRDLATPEGVGVSLGGEGSGPNGSLTYLDTAKLEITAQSPARKNLKAPPPEIAAFVHRNGGQATPAELRDEFGCSDSTLRARRRDLQKLGIGYRQAGCASRYVVEVDTLANPHSNPQHENAGTGSGQVPLNHADSAGTRENPRNADLGATKRMVEPKAQTPELAPPTGVEPRAAGHGSPPSVKGDGEGDSELERLAATCSRLLEEA